MAYGSGRRLWTVDQKLLMLRDAFGSGGGVCTAMERHEVFSGQLYTWRKQAMSGELSGFSAPALAPVLPGPVPCFAEVEIAEQEQRRVVAEPTGQIGITLSSGIKLSARLPVPPARRNACGMTDRGCVSSPSVWTGAVSSGR